MTEWLEEVDTRGPVQAYVLCEPGEFCTVNLSDDIELAGDEGIAYVAAVGLARVSRDAVEVHLDALRESFEEAVEFILRTGGC